MLRSQVDVVLPHGAAVLNAHDPHVVEMAPLSDGEVIFYGLDETHPVIVQHRAQGGRAVFLRDGHVVVGAGAESTPLVNQEAPPRRRNGRPKPAEECVLAAVGAAVALGLTQDAIVTGIETFDLNGAGASRTNGRPPKAAVR